MSKNKSQYGVLTLIYALYFFAPTISAITPALAEITSAYPSVGTAAVGYVVTITAVLQAVSALVAGAIAGRMVKFRTLLIFGSTLYIVTGCFPFVLADGQGFTALLVSRAFFGIATGIVMPLSNSLVMIFFSNEGKRAGIVGIGNVVLSVGTIVTNLIGGYLCLVSWQTTFLVYALGAVMLVLSFLFLKDSILPEPPSHNDADGAGDKPKKSKDGKAHIPMIVFGYLLMFILVVVATQPMIVYNAQYIVSANIGDSVTAGYTMTAFSIGGIVASLSFKKVYGVLGQWLLPVVFFLAFISALCGYTGSVPGAGSIVLYACGIFLAGVSLLFITCYTPIVITTHVVPEMVTVAMGLVSFAMAIGTFLTTPFAQLVSILTASDGIRDVLMGAGYCTLAIGVCVLAALLIGGAKKKLQERS